MEEKMYKAIEEIGGYEIGDEVPVEKAMVWMQMYLVSPVEEVKGNSEEDKPVEKPEEAPKENSNPMHDDYLNRNADVVKKAIKQDDLKKDVLESLLKIESSNKNRKPVIDALNLKLEDN